MTTASQDEIDSAIDSMLEGLPPVVTTEQACERLLIKRRELYRRVSRGEIMAARATDMGSARLMIPKTALAKYLRDRMVR